jgi:hypothetical protein
MPTRRKLTTVDKLRILIRECHCPLCGEKLGSLDDVEFDHEIALVNGGEDSISNLRGVHRACHSRKTHGPGNERRITTAGSDRHIAAKVDRLAERQAEFEARRSALLRPDPKPEPARSTWPKRPMRRKESRHG